MCFLSKRSKALLSTHRRTDIDFERHCSPVELARAKARTCPFIYASSPATMTPCSTGRLDYPSLLFSMTRTTRSASMLWRVSCRVPAASSSSDRPGTRPARTLEAASVSAILVSCRWNSCAPVHISATTQSSLSSKSSKQCPSLNTADLHCCETHRLTVLCRWYS